MSPKFWSCVVLRKVTTRCFLLQMIEIWKQHLDKGTLIGVLLMDLSIAFDTINYSLLMVILEAYGFSANSSKLLLRYFYGIVRYDMIYCDILTMIIFVISF